ncbi:MAG: TonB-dependent receptor [Chitinophagaceae bacterium]|nr:TonB-dependent receptor [Chitinophagaceae bacterium]
MRKSFRPWIALLGMCFLSLCAFAQTVTISGNVRNSTNKDVVPAVSISIKGASGGTFTDEKGNFRLTTSQPLPLTLIITSIGFEAQEVTVSSASDNVQVEFVPGSSLGVEVVVSASRVPERILESPVSIERISIANIRNTPATSYYDIFRNVKGVDLTMSSLTFNTVSTRGFNGSGSARVNQIVDGMDNQAPGLNFSVGNIVGLTELDVESMELLPGASSVLYGSGGMNGTVLINSKNPFRYQGLSFQVKTGIMHTDKRQRSSPSPYYDWTVRWGEKVSEKFAFKIGAQFIHAKDWLGTDSSNYQTGDASVNQYGNVKAGTRSSDPAYDGVNVYGDETVFDTKSINGTNLFGLVAAGVRAQLPNDPLKALFDNIVAGYTTPFTVSRTGYHERDVVNNNTINFKLSGGLYYKLTEKIEASLIANWGTGNTVYTGSDRYSLKELKIGQYKIEVKSTDWLVRAFTTQENAGESYNATIATRLFNEAWSPSAQWYQAYQTAFFQSKLGLLPGQAPGTVVDDFNSHQRARQVADANRPAPGSPTFQTLFDKVRSTPIKSGGGLFLDRSDLYQAEGQYNISKYVKVVDLLVGASVKQYVLNSEGTLFADTAGRIKISEFGAYAQIAKSFFNDRFKLTAAGRYDKNENFQGRFTPRFTGVLKIAKDHNLRVSYQTAYRFPTTQNQWINLVVGGGTVLMGGLPELRKFYNFRNVSGVNDNPGGNPAYTLASVRQFGGAVGAAIAGGTPPQDAIIQNVGLLREQVFGEYKAETMKSFEVGYKGLFGKKVFVDVYGYFGRYENFLGRVITMQSLAPGGSPAGLLAPSSPSTNRIVSVAVNAANEVKTYGFGASIDWVLPRNFTITGNVSVDRIDDLEPGFVSFFNVPSARMNFGLSNSGFGLQKRFGFSVMVRTQDDFFYESDFRQGTVNGFTNVDAQVSFKLPAKRSIVKLGATNVFNTYYKTAFGNPEIGGIYYLSFGYNIF